MKKMVCLMVGVLWITAVSAPVFADQAKTSSTPTANTTKHKKSHSHKGSKKGKGTMKTTSTPTAK